MHIFDPKKLIRPPFTVCPKCNKSEFGVLTINGNSYVKRCRSCWADAKFHLPQIVKKVIYLDQFVISEMMKSINPASRSYSNEKLKPYREIYEKLDHLSKLQLIICPQSINHRDESLLMTGSFEWMKSVYEQLSHATSFKAPVQIKQLQIYNNLRLWLGQEVSEITPSDVIMGDVNRWNERYRLTVNRDFDQSEIDEITSERDKVAALLVDNFRLRQAQPNTTLDDFYRRELNGFGQSILERQDADLKRLLALSVQDPAEYVDLLLVVALSANRALLQVVKEHLVFSGTQHNEVLNKMREYLTSDVLKEVPFVQIASMLFASLAREAADGRSKLPTRGMLNDIQMIASYSPYCDAIFIDQECHSLLRKLPKQSQAYSAKVGLRLDQKIYSAATLEEFLHFLDGIEKNASQEHLELVRTVYGPDWGEPFTTMFAST